MTIKKIQIVILFLFIVCLSCSVDEKCQEEEQLVTAAISYLTEKSFYFLPSPMDTIGNLSYKRNKELFVFNNYVSLSYFDEEFEKISIESKDVSQSQAKSICFSNFSKIIESNSHIKGLFLAPKLNDDKSVKEWFDNQKQSTDSYGLLMFSKPFELNSMVGIGVHYYCGRLCDQMYIILLDKNDYKFKIGSSLRQPHRSY